MQRRDVLKRTALLLGYALSASSIAAIMNGCSVDAEIADKGLAAWEPTFLSKEEGNTIAYLSECIIPETETPGAIAAGVYSFIDVAIANRLTNLDKTTFKNDIKFFNERFEKEQGTTFLKADEATKIAFLTKFEKEAHDQSKSNIAPKHFWLTVKELTVLGYCTSEVGAKQALKFDPIPGEYKACIPLSEVGGAWAL